MLLSVKKIHFIGIGGIGMSGIAELLHNKDFLITGSDIAENSNVSRLRDIGININIEHSPENILDQDLVVFSDAIPMNNIELETAKSKNIMIYSRAQMLQEISKLNNSTVAIAGTHGKTTTTSIIGGILKDSKLDPTIIVGGVIKSIDSNSLLGKGDTFVVEADEYNKTFMQLNPTIAVINNIDFEHIECYSSIEELKECFTIFANNVPFYGKVCACLDSNNVRDIIKNIDKPILTYGIDSDDVDLKAENIVQKNGSMTFDVKIKNQLIKFSMNTSGKYNVYNALAAIAVCLTMEIDIYLIKNGIKNFEGVKRRFDIQLDDKIMVVDDYAHHPVEVDSVIKKVKDKWSRNITVIFQQHLFSRTKRFYKEFADALFNADKIFITEIFASREKNDSTTSSKLILDELLIRLNHKDAHYVDLNKIVKTLKPISKEGDIILTLGAGNIWRFAKKLAEEFK